MKLNFSNSKKRFIGGIMLIECLVYIAVFAILLGIGFSSFYLFWDNSLALHETADDIGGALRAGETWRADIRGATGKIQITNSPDGVFLKIPEGKSEISYRFFNRSVWRLNAGSKILILPRVKTSQMESENRDQIQAWRWELELMPHRSRAKMPLQFSFEAVQKS